MHGEDKMQEISSRTDCRARVKELREGKANTLNSRGLSTLR